MKIRKAMQDMNVKFYKEMEIHIEIENQTEMMVEMKKSQ